MIASYSVAAYCDTREGALGLGLLALAIATAIALDPSDDLSNIAPTLVLFLLLPGAFGFTVQLRSRDVSELSERVIAAERALTVEREGRARKPVAAMPLTRRQTDVVLLIARGFSNKGDRRRPAFRRTRSRATSATSSRSTTSGTALSWRSEPTTAGW